MNSSGFRRDRRSGSQDSMYRPRSGTSISSLRPGRPFSGATWAWLRMASGVLSVTGSPLVRVEDEADGGHGWIDGVGAFDEEGEHVVERRILLARPAHAPLVPVADGAVVRRPA